MIVRYEWLGKGKNQRSKGKNPQNQNQKVFQPRFPLRFIPDVFQIADITEINGAEPPETEKMDQNGDYEGK